MVFSKECERGPRKSSRVDGASRGSKWFKDRACTEMTEKMIIGQGW